MASRWLRFIFQLPAISGVRASGSFVLRAIQSSSACRPGQRLPSRYFQARAAAGGDVAEGVLVEAEGAHGGGGVAATDDREALAVDQRLRDRAGAGGERRPSRTRPSGRSRRSSRDSAQRRGERGPAGRADVQAHPVGRDRVGGHDDGVGVGGEAVGGDDVGRQDQLDAALLGLGQVALARSRSGRPPAARCRPRDPARPGRCRPSRRRRGSCPRRRAGGR